MANIIASIITIGDELLIGQTIDTNSAWMAQRLNDLGVDVRHRIAVGDDDNDIRHALDQERKLADIILITGGLGPTADDITKPLLLDYFGGKMIVNEEVLAEVRSIFEKRNMPMLERNLKQAEVPDNCIVLPNRQGTAPGMLFAIPNTEKPELEQWFISMPGVPHEMMGIMNEEVIPRLQQQFAGDALVHQSIVTAGLGESFIAEKIKDLEEALPTHIRLAYLPGHWMVKLRLTGRGSDKQRLHNELQMRAEEIANRLEDVVISMEDLSLEHIIGKLLTARQKTIGLAESCTGGNIAQRVTEVMGAGNYFQGSIVCYQYEVKERILAVDHSLLQEKGAVCEEVASQMAIGAMKVLDADYGFGITGLLSPSNDEKVRTGTVWMAVADKDRVVTKSYLFPYDRIRNKEVATQMGLLLIWKFISGKI
jgi:nicotinamide-nucleotide amidase